MRIPEEEIGVFQDSLSVPARYAEWEGRRVKVILVPVEEQPAQPSRTSWRERMTLMPVLKTTSEALLEPVAEPS